MILYLGIIFFLSNLLLIFGYVYYVRWLIGYVQNAVFVVLQHVEHITFTTLLCYLAACRQRFVFGVLQFFLQFVQLDDIVLDIVSVGYVDNEQKTR